MDEIKWNLYPDTLNKYHVDGGDYDHSPDLSRCISPVRNTGF